MTLAIGGSSGSVLPPHGVLWADVRDYGAKADSGVTDNAVTFQAAVDALAAQLSTSTAYTKGVVFIPSAPEPYVLRSSVWVDSSSIEIQGEGWGSCVQIWGANSAFIFGIVRVGETVSNGTTVPVTIGSTYRPDLYGLLDTSAVTAAGTFWGIRTFGNSWVQFQASPISSGVGDATSAYYLDNWSETSRLTFECCIAPPSGQLFPTNAPLFSLGSVPNEPSPFTISIWDDPNTVLVIFRTSDIAPGPVSPYRYFSLSLAGYSPPYRIAIQFDLVDAVCTAFVNGVQVALTATLNLSSTSTVPFVANSGVTFVTNDHFPFMIGTQGLQGSFGGATGVDLSVYGLRMSNTLRYLNRGAGQAQQRADSPSTAINDAYAYFGQDANTICFLRCTDNPATAGRVVTVEHGNVAVQGGTTTGIFFNNIYPSGLTDNAIRNICVEGLNGFGQLICLGVALQMKIDNVRAINGFHGIGSFVMQANYNVYLSNCDLSGSSDAGYFGAIQLLYAQNINFGSIGRTAMRHVGCNAAWRNVFVGFPHSTTEAAFKARGFPYGGNYAITELNVNFEGPTFSLAAIYCEAHALAPATSLLLRDIFFGTVGANVPLIMVKDIQDGNSLINRCWLSVENMQAFTNSYLAAIEVDGPLWCGEMSGVALTGPQFNHRQTWGTTTNVVIRDTKYTGPPRQYLWYNGAHILEVRSPAAGQFTQWRCVGTGTYGTSTPPTWLGLDPLLTSQNCLAAYVLNQVYITAKLI